MSWKNVEENILNTMDFLRKNIAPSPYAQNDPIKCSECLLRMLSILITSGEIKVTKISYPNNKIWRSDDYKIKNSNKKPHGATWHNNMMAIIKNYFNNHDLCTYSEPDLHYGKADLYIRNINTYIEVGSINLYKLYLNLYFMHNCKIIIVPSEYYSIEFEI